MQHPVMSTSKAELRQDFVGVANEVSVGKEQEFDQVERHHVALPRFGRDHTVDWRHENYVSHVDIFLVLCYRNKMLGEKIVR
jgi:hypothetical protein